MKDPRAFATERLGRIDAAVRTRVLPSGLTLVALPMPGEDRTYLGMTVGAGSRSERAAESGISHFLEHMMFRGSRMYPDFTALAEAFEGLGGEWNAATGHEHTEYWYGGVRQTAGEAIELFADFLTHPAFHSLDVERQIILRELDAEMNDHGNCTDLDYHVATLAWPSSELARPIIGTEATLSAIGLPELRRYRDRLYVPRNTVVCAVGGGDDAQATLEALTAAFAGYRAEHAGVPRAQLARPAAFAGPAARWVEHSDNEYEIRLSFPCPGEFAPEAKGVELLARVLSDGFASMLTRRLREELGLVYDINAGAALGLDVGTLDVQATCAIDQLDEFLRELLLLMRELAEKGPTPAAAQRASLRAVVELEHAATMPEALGGRLAWAVLAGESSSLVREREAILAVTHEGLCALARRLVRASNAILVALGPAGDDVEGRLARALRDGLPA
jgi:predicted Zn-dependent peptidase